MLPMDGSPIAPAITEITSSVTSTIPVALAVGAVVVGASIAWRVGKKFFS